MPKVDRIVGVDVDGVVADLHHEWLRRYNVDYNDRLTREDIGEWDIARVVKSECGGKIYDYINNPDIFRSVPAIGGARVGVAMLRDRGYRVIFLTNATKNTIESRIAWLEMNNFLPTDRFYHEDFISVADKHLIRAQWLIDDNPENLARFQGRGILFSQPWNAKHIGYPRLNRWSEILDVMGAHS